MPSDDFQPATAIDPDWLEFESVLGELAKLAQSTVEFDRLAGSLLEETVHMLAAVGGAIWLTTGSSPLRRVCQINLDVLDDAATEPFHDLILSQARSIDETLAVPPGGATLGRQQLPNPTSFTLLIGPLKIDHDVVGLFEIIQRSSPSAATMRGNRRLLGLVCELAADHLRRRELRHLRDDRIRAEQFDKFAERIHGTLDVRTVAYELANAGRQIVDCDRVSVTIRYGRRCKLIAVSSVDSLDRRSNTVRQLEKITSQVALMNDTIWYDGGNDVAIAPQIAQPLERYADDAHPRALGLIPLKLPATAGADQRTQSVGVLIVENFNSVLDYAARERATRVAGQSASALLNAARYESLPTLPFARHRSDPLRRSRVRPLWALAAVAAIAAVISLWFIPVEFNIDAQGELQPREQQHVFAPFDGQVTTISVHHGDPVAPGDLLLELRSSDIDLESQRLQGELDTTQQRISSIESSLLQMSSAEEADRNRANQLAAEQEELLQQLASQRSQLELLRDQREKLVLRSPLNGQVLTWELEKSLADRPVQRGQLLLTVANLDGPWVAELEVPDDQVGYVLDAGEVSNSLAASFQLATRRGVEYRGVIRRISTRTELDDRDRPIVRVTMDVDSKALQERRPGATIFAKIQCGHKSLAYVLFHDLVETARNWLRF